LKQVDKRGRKYANRGRRAASIKTRIETTPHQTSMYRVVVVAGRHPSKQGLKLHL